MPETPTLLMQMSNVKKANIRVTKKSGLYGNIKLKLYLRTNNILTFHQFRPINILHSFFLFFSKKKSLTQWQKYVLIYLSYFPANHSISFGALL